MFNNMFNYLGKDTYNVNLTHLNLVGVNCMMYNGYIPSFRDMITYFMEKNPKLSLTLTDCNIRTIDKLLLQSSSNNNRITFNSLKEQSSCIVM